MATSRKHSDDVATMFNNIARRYDFLNQILSFGLFAIWRNRLVKRILQSNPGRVLDVATGTADVAIALAKRDKNIEVVGVDIAEKMLAIAASKVKKEGLDHRITLSLAGVENIPFDDDSFCAATVAYGVRNFTNPLLGLKMMYRVIVPGGNIHILEFTKPKLWFMRIFFGFYFNHLLPLLGRLISGHKHAYTYLSESVKGFAEREEFVKLLLDAGFVSPVYSVHSFGVAAIYSASKPQGQ